jgi:hypothetical protein
MAEDIRGYVSNEIIRKDAGSGTPTTFVFSKLSESVMIDNLGTEKVFFAFDDNVASVGSTSGIVPEEQTRVFDVRVGSVSILGSGGNTPNVQCVCLR